MDYYNLDDILAHAIRNNIDISPSDRGEWALMCCALKTLGYNEETFIYLSSCSPQDSRKKWREEKSPNRYFPSPDNAKAKLIALAKAAGMDLTPFTPRGAKWGKVGLSGVSGVSGVNHALPTSAPNEESRANPEPDSPIYITPEKVEKMEKRVKETTLYSFLCSLFPPVDVDGAMARYRIGATTAFGSDPGLASAFPYINAAGNCIDIHLQPYDTSGHRKKDGFNQDWQLRRDGYNERRGKWCLFGEHLLMNANPSAPVGIVESEKTALICSMYFPGYIWMATGSLSNLNARRCAALRERDVYIFPDMDGISKWRERANALHAEGFRVFFCGDTIKRHATGAKDDLGDIVLTDIKTAKQ